MRNRRWDASPRPLHAFAVLVLLAGCGEPDARDAACARLADEVRAVWNRDARGGYEARTKTEKYASDDVRWFDAYASELSAARIAACGDRRDDRPGAGETASCLARGLDDLRAAIARKDVQFWPELQPIGECTGERSRSIARIPTARPSPEAVLSPAATRIAVTEVDGSFRIVDRRGEPAGLPELDEKEVERAIEWLPDGRLVATQRGRPVVFDPSGKKLGPLQFPANPFSISPDLRTTLINTAEGLEIVALDEEGPLIDPHGPPLVTATELTAGVYSSFSPDSTKIAIQAFLEKSPEILLRDMRTGTSSRIPYRAHVKDIGIMGVGWLDENMLVVGGSVTSEEVASRIWRLRLDPELRLAAAPEPIVRGSTDVALTVADTQGRFVLVKRTDMKRSVVRIGSDGSRVPVASLDGFTVAGIDSTGEQVFLRRGRDRIIATLDPVRLRAVPIPPDLNQVTFALHGQEIVGVGAVGKELHVFDDRGVMNRLDLVVKENERVLGIRCADSLGCLIPLAAPDAVRFVRVQAGVPTAREVARITVRARAWALDPAGRTIAMVVPSKEAAGTAIETYDLQTRARQRELLPCAYTQFIELVAGGRQVRTSCGAPDGFSIVGTDLDTHTSKVWFTAQSWISGIVSLDANTVLVSEVDARGSLELIEVASR